MGPSKNMESILTDCDLAIICPVYNCLDYTKQFLGTIKTNRDYRLIIINNGSIDRTREYLASIAENNRVDIINLFKNEGVAYAWNFGIKLAIQKYNSKYLFIPNNDVLLNENTIDKLIEIIRDGKIMLVSATNRNDGKLRPENLKYQLVPSEKELKEEPDFSCFMIKKETVEKIGLFDENFKPAYFEDNDYHYRIRLAGYKAVKDNQNIYYHFGSMTIRENDEAKMFSNTRYLLNKEYYRGKWGGYPGQEIYDKPWNK